ncbi:MAG TPA: cold shock domain-containing protein [Solirubrobacterales bacterium]|nr:cold shock domain-containing protein [Solirubrobacterales bacterium]
MIQGTVLTERIDIQESLTNLPGSGTVVSFDDAKGFGLIIDDEGTERYVHRDCIAGSTQTLVEGGEVTFRRAINSTGPSAIDVVEVRSPDTTPGKNLVGGEDELSVRAIEKRMLGALRLQSFTSPATLRAAVAPQAAVGVNRTPFHRAFDEALERLELNGTIAGWPTPDRTEHWSGRSLRRESVLAAIDEFDRSGRKQTLSNHGFRKALDYVVLHEGNEYDSKALYAIAYGLQYPQDPPLREQPGFSGGVALVKAFEELGFRIKRLRAKADAALTREGARAWIVRAGRRGENEDLARDENVVLIGWSKLGKIGPDTSRERLKELVRATGEDRDASVNAQAGSIYRFIHEMREGDLVVLPLQREQGRASVGVIESAFIYRPDGVFKDRDAHYQREVTWLSWGLPYESFDSDLRSAFGAQGTVSEIQRDDSVGRILSASRHSPDDPAPRQDEDAAEPERSDPEPVDREPFEERSAEEIAKGVRAAGISISDRMFRRYHLALRTRGFVILAGISGGGKTWLAETYAIASGAELLVVPVAPNWTTNEDLLGYLNPIDGSYCHTPFSRFMTKAATDYALATQEGRAPRPYNLVLDEMNLARVEHYFAKFLSAMEARTRNGTCPVHLAPDLTVELTPNLQVIGTVNVDETTYGFADKIFDRAQLIELEVPRDALHTHVEKHDYGDTIMRIWDAIHPIAPFGFRVLDEVAIYTTEALNHGSTWQEALDDLVLQKVLPKIKGTDPKLGGVLEELELATQDDLPFSHAKVKSMRSDFIAHGFVSYF